MGSSFNPQILADKLSKVNSSQQSIETLSHWCIFHMHKARQVVETWDRQFHCAPREQRVAFLYLANDILQNSRRKGAEYVAEFWKVLPDSLRDVIANGDESGRNAALRLISIWEERKVFGSRGQLLKEEFVKRPLDNGNRNVKHVGSGLRSPGGNALDKLVSGFQAVYGSQLDEAALFSKCRDAISFVEKVDKDIEGDYRLGHSSSGMTDELKGQSAILRDCVEQLRVVESSRTNLVSLLREALQEQEYKLGQVRDQLQAAQTRSEQADNICRSLLGPNGNDQSTSVIYTRQVSTHTETNPKSAAAAMAEKLAASTSSAQMLTYVLSSLASGVMSNPVQDSSTEYPSEKRAKIENNSHELNPDERPPPPSSPPPEQPLPPPVQPYVGPQYMQTAMPMLSGPYVYNMGLQPPATTVTGYVPVGPPNGGVSGGPTVSGVSGGPPYQSYPTEGSFYGQPMGPMGHQ